jgi:hypothetical protein
MLNASPNVETYFVSMYKNFMPVTLSLKSIYIFEK